MSSKPIFLATHPRSCSTAFERVFMTRADLQCIHEPFGDAFYYGPERHSPRFAQDEQARKRTGFSESTYQSILDTFKSKIAEGKRLFIKDMAYYICSDDVPVQSDTPFNSHDIVRDAQNQGRINQKDGLHSDEADQPAPNGLRKPTISAPCNPTVLPNSVLEEFHFAFLIRHPRNAIPSYFRCCRPPLDKVTGFYEFLPSEAGYRELRQLFEYLRSVGQIGSGHASEFHSGKRNSAHDSNATDQGQVVHGRLSDVAICVIDADDLLDKPGAVVEAFCKSVGLQYHSDMLRWDSNTHHEHAKDAFEKWPGFHEDAMNSSDLKPRIHHTASKTALMEDAEWREKYGEAGAKVIRDTVDANLADYEYLKRFALKV